jgi:para-aminobenzoate synthetase component 1
MRGQGSGAGDREFGIDDCGLMIADSRRQSNPQYATPVLHCTVLCRKIPASPNLAALSELFALRPGPAILGGNEAGEHGFSYWAAEPIQVLEINRDDPDPVGRLQRELDRFKLDNQGRHPLPDGLFCGGWIGFFSYDLGRSMEPLPCAPIDDLHTPLVRLAFYDQVLAYDHARKAVWLIALRMPGDSGEPCEKLDRLGRILDQADEIRVRPPCPADVEHVGWAKTQSNMTQAQYLAAVARIQRHIVDGDVYQVNFSQRFSCPFAARPIDLFHWQSAFNPSPYAAYIDTPALHIVSASPEMFLTIGGGFVRTKPIKGTRPRITETAAWAQRANEQAFRELAASEKDQAELAMIVDLERNDLARICIPGTRQVLAPRTIEACPTVYHAVAVVGGRLAPDVPFRNILRATFPGGSITGAPKIRAMEIIDAVEPCARGLYTGSIGFIGVDGTACLNIAIRTIIIADQTAYVQVGGGIVADSDPQAEYEETLVKARALLAGIEASRIGEEDD